MIFVNLFSFSKQKINNENGLATYLNSNNFLLVNRVWCLSSSKNYKKTKRN